LKIIKPSNKRVVYILFKLLGAGVLCFVGLYFYEVFPRFITLSIHLPSDDYPSQLWSFPTYSVIQPGQTRYFSWQEFAILSYKGLPEEKSRQLIINYFDQELLKQGWFRSKYDSNSYANCYDEKIFPEAFFLHPSQDFSQDGFAMYKRKKLLSFISSKVSDEICLAIWKHWDNVPGIFNIVIFTIKPSPFTWILDRNEFQFSR
jgi:hypothetical protein